MFALEWIRNSTIGRSLFGLVTPPATAAAFDDLELTPLREPELEKVVAEICRALDHQADA